MKHTIEKKKLIKTLEDLLSLVQKPEFGEGINGGEQFIKEMKFLKNVEANFRLRHLKVNGIIK